MKQVLHNPEVDAVLKNKLTGEQQASLKELKDAIFETERKKAGNEKRGGDCFDRTISFKLIITF